MATGLAVALAGLLLRRRVPAEPRSEPSAPGGAARARPPQPGRAGRRAQGPPAERTLPTRLAARDGWWSEGVEPVWGPASGLEADDAAFSKEPASEPELIGEVEATRVPEATRSADEDEPAPERDPGSDAVEPSDDPAAPSDVEAPEEAPPERRGS
jgi:hypothetical protein